MAVEEKDLKAIFVDRTGILSEEEFTKAQAIAKKIHRPLTQIVMERGSVSARYFLELLGDFFRKPVAELRIAEVDRDTLTTISEIFATTHLVVPFARSEHGLKVAFADPRDRNILEMVEKTAGMPIEPYVATEQAIRRALILYRGDIREHLKTIAEKMAKDASINRTGKRAVEEAPSVVLFLDSLIEDAVLAGASDVHIEPFEEETVIRFRIDGLLRTVLTIPKTLHDVLAARVKVLGGLRIDERRLPQDGRFTTQVSTQPVDVRVSVVPSYWGEKAAMRILPKMAELFDLGNIGLLDSDLAIIKRNLQRAFGMILVCGPTGSGKTTTLYTFLQEIGVEKTDVVNISTVEDPIEYTVQRVTQIQIRPDIDLSFAIGLRALLRQDPDIIMVGEIRDKDTADIAVRAALVGRLLLSSLHTNDAVGAIPRLLDMGVEPYLVSSTLSLVLAQRLARRLCTHCRESYVPKPEVLKRLREITSFDEAVAILKQRGHLPQKTDSASDFRFFRANGCNQCNHTGYQGRVAVFEIFEVTDAMRPHITARKDASVLSELARKEGMKTLFADGLAKVVLGITDLDELMRVAT